MPHCLVRLYLYFLPSFPLYVCTYIFPKWFLYHYYIRVLFVLILYFHLNYLILFLPCFCLKIYGFWISCLCSFIGSVWWPKKFRKTKGSGLCILKNPHSTKRNGTIVFGKVVQETQKRETQTCTHRR